MYKYICCAYYGSKGLFRQVWLKTMEISIFKIITFSSLVFLLLSWNQRPVDGEVALRFYY